MPTIIILTLVAALSGVPAAAVFCDLVLCVPPVEAEAQGCHEHASSQSGDAVAAVPGDCTHLAVSAPFVPSATVQAGDAATSGTAYMSPAPSDSGVSSGARVGRSGPPVSAPISSVLRI